MRVGQLVASVSRRRSGIFEFTCGLSRAVAESGAESRVFGIHDDGTEADAHRWQPVTPYVARHVGPRMLGLAPRLLPALLRSQLDVLHAHGLWTLQSAQTLAWAARTRRPYVVSVHGMMNPWALGRSRGRKRIASAVYEHRRLRKAACLHAVGEHETGFLRSGGFESPVAEIPYGVDTPLLDAALPLPVWRDRIEPGRPVLLYLGRLDPIKGLENLVLGWMRARREDARAAAPWALVIAGWGDAAYETLLRKLASEEADGSIVFPGPLFGLDREAAYRAAQACVLPSLSEGLPVGILEGWARARGALVTEACHLAEGRAAGAALRVGPGPEGMSSALRELFAMPVHEREAMGRRGRALIERRYSWPVVGRQFLDLYAWLAGGGPAPAFVRGA